MLAETQFFFIPSSSFVRLLNQPQRSKEPDLSANRISFFDNFILCMFRDLVASFLTKSTDSDMTRTRQW